MVTRGFLLEKEMKQVTVMIDAGFFSKKFREANDNMYPWAKHVVEFAKNCVIKDEEELFRIYYYDCPPFEGIIKEPLSGKEIEYKSQPQTLIAKRFQSELSKSDYVALRKGYLSFDGWVLKQECLEEIMTKPRTLIPSDFAPLFRQKKVDIKIGLDVAWLSSKKIVDRIILVAGDYDFEPVMKFARKEGIQVVLVTLKHAQIKGELREHCDIFRAVELPKREARKPEKRSPQTSEPKK
jgi:uncharacterized LabA/DUF88 family protein